MLVVSCLFCGNAALPSVNCIGFQEQLPFLLFTFQGPSYFITSSTLVPSKPSGYNVFVLLIPFGAKCLRVLVFAVFKLFHEKIIPARYSPQKFTILGKFLLGKLCCCHLFQTPLSLRSKTMKWETKRLER